MLRLAFLCLLASITFGLNETGLSTNVWAQPATPATEQSATYVSPVDDALTIRRIAVLPATDNVDGIYGRPIESQLITLTRESHRWDYTEVALKSSMPSVADLEEKPSEFSKLVKNLDADAFFVASASRGPGGLSMRLDLFLKKDGKLLAQEVLKDQPRTEIPQLVEQVKMLYQRLLAKLPYQGLILSRQNNRVTINLGKSDGLRKDQVVSAVQIISLNRHPKFNFIISSDKEILGRIKVLKVEDTLSFGAIVSEKERGAIRRLAKISALSEVNYGDPTALTPDADKDLTKRADAGVAFGSDAKEWVPMKPPAFGEVGLRLGFGLYNSSLNLNTTPSCCEAKSAFYPSLNLHGELWLNPHWIARAEIMQGVLSTPNPRQGSSPSDLNHAFSRYSLIVGYNFLLRDDFFGPKIQVDFGLASARMYVDDSKPRSLTTTTFSGAVLGVMGSFPVTDDKIWYAGGKFNLSLFPKVSETPVTSGGDAKASINDFSLFIQRKLGENIRATGSLDFSLYSVNYSGDADRTDPVTGLPESATSLSQRHTIFSGGIVYMF